MTQRQHTLIAVILVLTGMYLIRLAAPEIQPGDEGLNALVSIGKDVTTGTAEATRNSGTLALLAKPFTAFMGATATAFRLPIVVCSGLCFALLLSLLRRVVSQDLALWAVCILAGSFYWTMHSKAFIDVVPTALCLLVALWSVVRWYDSGRKHLWLVATFCMATVVASMMRMEFAWHSGLFLAALAVYPGRTKRDMAFVALCALISLSGLLVVSELGLSAAHIHAKQGSLVLGEYIQNHALSLATLVGIGCMVVVQRLRTTLSEPVTLAGICWLVVILVQALADGTTSSTSSVALASVPTAIVMATFISNARRNGSRRLLVFVYALCVINALLLLVPGLSAKNMLSGTATMIELAIAGACIVVAALPVMLKSSAVATASVRLFKPVLYGVVGAMLLRSMSVVMFGSSAYVSGGMSVAKHLREEYAADITYVYSSEMQDSVNTQLAWYARDIVDMTSADRSTRRYSSYEVNDTNFRAVTLLVATLAQHNYIVYASSYTRDESSKERSMAFERGIAQSYFKTDSVGNYTIFKRR